MLNTLTTMDMLAHPKFGKFWCYGHVYMLGIGCS